MAHGGGLGSGISGFWWTMKEGEQCECAERGRGAGEVKEREMAGSMNLSLEQTGQPHLRIEQTLARNSAVEVDGGPENGLDLLRA